MKGEKKREKERERGVCYSCRLRGGGGMMGR